MSKKRAKQLKGKVCIDVGCGFNCQDGFIGMDKRPETNADIIHDIEVMPWPIARDSCHVVLMSHLIEHVKPWLTIDIINEAWRVCVDGGLLLISTPYATSFGYLQDPTHCNPWNEATPTYFIKGQPLYEIYRPLPWKAERVVYDKMGNMEIALRKILEGQNNEK